MPDVVQSAQPAADECEDTMLGYFLSTLAVRALQIKPTVVGDPTRQALFDELQTSMDIFPKRFSASSAPANHGAWTEAYRLERVLALVEPPSNLVAELKRQTAEAVEEGIPAASRLITALEAALPVALDTSHSPPTLRPCGEPILRALLVQTLEELHWNSQRKFYARPIQKSATYRIVYLGLAAFLLFLFPYGFIYIRIFAGHEPALAFWSGLPLYTALTAGLFGAFFSRLLYLQQNWNGFTLGAIMDARDFTSILLRGCVGMTGAAIVYFFSTIRSDEWCAISKVWGDWFRSSYVHCQGFCSFGDTHSPFLSERCSRAARGVVFSRRFLGTSCAEHPRVHRGNSRKTEEREVVLLSFCPVEPGYRASRATSLAGALFCASPPVNGRPGVVVTTIRPAASMPRIRALGVTIVTELGSFGFPAAACD